MPIAKPLEQVLSENPTSPVVKLMDKVIEAVQAV